MAALSYNLSLSFAKNSSSLSTFPSQFISPSNFQSGNGFRVRPKRNAPRTLTLRSVRESKAAVVTGNSWEKSILKNDIPVLVEFYASWCGPCRMVHRVIDDLAEEYEGKLKCFMLNTDNDLKVAEDYEIKAVPVVLLFKNGQKRDCIVGTMPKEYYMAAIEKVLAS